MYQYEMYNDNVIKKNCLYGPNVYKFIQFKLKFFGYPYIIDA